jgi:uncharacterized membrane protein
MARPHESRPGTSRAQTIGQRVLGAALVTTGLGHLTWLRQEFQAQVPSWLPLDEDAVVVASGVIEIALGVALLVADKHRVLVGWMTAAFFVVIFPGNVAQYVDGVDAFGLDSDTSRAVRLALQPLLVVAALWSTGAWDLCRRRRERAVALRRAAEG